MKIKDAREKDAQSYAGKLEQIVSGTDFYVFLFSDLDGGPYVPLALEVAAASPAALKRREPLKFLRLAYLLFAAGRENAYHALIEEMKDIIAAIKGPKKGAGALLGEWTFVAALRYFRDPGRLAEEYEKALRLLSAPSAVVTQSDPFAFCMMGVYGIFLRKPGTADNVSKKLRRALTLYSELTRGGGAGTDLLYDADIAFLRGELDRAEVLAYKAAYIAESRKDSLLLINASEILMRCALYHADLSTFTRAAEQMENAVKNSGRDKRICALTRDLAYGIIYPSLGLTDKTAECLKDVSFSLRDDVKGGKSCMYAERIAINMGRVPTLSFGTAFICHIFYFCLSGGYRKTIGAIELMEPLWEEAEYLTLALYSALFKAACHAALGDMHAARAEVRKAAAAALADGFYLALAQFSPLLGGLVEEELAHDEDAAAKVARLCEMQSGTKELLRKALDKTRAIAALSRREEEIAKLAAQGMRNREIALRLSLSEQTVRNYLSGVFRKLDITSRAELSGLMR